MVSFKFATIEESKEILLNKDEYLRKLLPHEYALKMKSKKKVNEEEFLTFLESCILPWNEDEIKKLNSVLNELKETLRLRINFTKPILLIKTDGREEWNSAYTRNTSIILPQSRIKNDSNKKLKELLIHELFHVISKKYPTLRNILYGLTGFYKINEVSPPEELAKRKLTNPDAPNMDYFTIVYYNGKSVPVVPLTLLRKGKTNVDDQKDILMSISTNLLALEKRDGKYKAVTGKMGPAILDLNEIECFQENTGTQTKDFQHPEETIANIFTNLVTGKNTITSKKLVDGLKKLIIE